MNINFFLFFFFFYKNVILKEFNVFVLHKHTKSYHMITLGVDCISTVTGAESGEYFCRFTKCVDFCILWRRG